MKKQILSLALVTAIFIASIPFSFAADTNTNMSTLDVILTAAAALNSPTEEDDILPSDASYKDIVPLYNDNGNIVAYYISFSPTGYAVVNNNTNNPTLIEFGEGDQYLIREILDSTTSPHIIYNNPVDVRQDNPIALFSASFQSAPLQTEEDKDLYAYYPDLLETDSGAVAQLNAQKAALKEKYPKLGLTRATNADYGFILVGDMAYGSSETTFLNQSSLVSWVTMSDFASSTVKDHCGSVAVMNIALYLREIANAKELKINNSNAQTFNAIYAIVKKGPTPTIAGGATTYFSNRGYSLHHSSANTVASVKTAIRNNRPCGILLMDNLLSMHWVVCMGYRTYSSSGVTFFALHNGWDNSYVYYRPDFGSEWMSGTQYWL